MQHIKWCQGLQCLLVCSALCISNSDTVLALKSLTIRRWT